MARTRALLLASVCLAPCAHSDATVDPARTLLTLSRAQYDALVELPILTPVPFTGAWTGGHTYRVAAEMAMDIINSQQMILPGYRLNSSWFDDRCDSDSNVQLVLQKWNDGAWVAMGGNGCSAVCRTAALMAPKLRLPYISYGCAAGILNDAKTFPDFGRFAPDENTLSNVFQSLAQTYNWTSMVIITGDPARFDGPAQATVNLFRNSTSTQVEWLTPHNPSWPEIQGMMQKVKRSGQRIIIVLGYEAFFRQVVCASMVVGMSRGAVWLSVGWHQEGWWSAEDRSLLALESRCTGTVISEYADGAIGADGLGMPLEVDMDRPVPCMPGWTPRTFWARMATAYVQGYPVGRNLVPGAPFKNAEGQVADIMCMWALMLRRMLVNDTYGVSDLVRPSAAVYKKMRDFLKNELDFFGVSGRIKFQGNNIPNNWGLSQIQQGQRAIVATVDTNLNLAFVSGSKLIWGDNSTNPGTFFPFCPDGSWRRPDGVCQLCAAGQYQDPALRECVACPMGRFSATSGAVAVRSCRRCANGEVANASGSSACRQCVPGTFGNPADDEAVACTLCPKGQHQSMPGMSQCTRCELGRVQPGLGGVDCEPCPLRRTTQFLGADSEEECACPAGTYSRPDLGCVDCLEGLVCRGGQDPPLQEEGYWADVLDGAARDYSVFRCRSARECPAGAAGLCPPGRGGRACARCEPRHYPTSDGSCSPCLAGDTLGPFLAGAAAIVVSVACAAFLFSRPELQPLSTLTLMILLGQIAGAVQSLGAIQQFQIQWMEPLRSVLKVMALLTFDFDVVRISCAFPQDAAVLRLVTQLLALPLVLSALGTTSLAVWAAQRRRRRLHREKAAAATGAARLSWNPEPFVNVAGMLTLTVFIPLTLATTNAMRCVGNPNGTKTMASNPGVVCWASKEHQVLIAISSVGLVVFPVATLAAVVRATLLHESWLANGGGLVKLRAHRFLFDRFTPARYKFGLCYLWRSATIALVPVIFVGQPMLQILAMVLIFLVNLLLQVSWWPWRTVLANYTDLLANAALLFFLAASAFLVDVGTVGQAKEALQVLLLAALSVVASVLLTGVVVTLRRRLCAKKPYTMFLCHHKAGAGVLSRYIKMMVWRSSKAEVFLDSDQLEDLQDIVDAVRSWTRHLVVVLTKDIMRRIWCASEIASAHLNKIPTVCLACDDFAPMGEAERGRLGEWWSQEQQRQVLAANGLTIEMVDAAYSWLIGLRQIYMPRFGSLEEKATAVDALMEACSVRRLGNRVTGGAARDAEVIVLGAVGEAESLSVCEVVALMLQFQLQAETAVIRNANDATAAVSGSAVYALVVLSRSLLSDVAFAEALLLMVRAPSHRDPVEVVTVLASGTIGDQGFTFPDAQFYADLMERGLGDLPGEDVAAAYREMLLILALPLSPLGSMGLIEKQLSEISRRFRRRRYLSGSEQGKGASSSKSSSAKPRESTVEVAPEPQANFSWDFDCDVISARKSRPIITLDWPDDIASNGIAGAPQGGHI